MRYLVGIDVGTSGTKALIIDEGGSLIASATAEYPMYTPHPQWAEQDPEDWWQATITAMNQAIQNAGCKPEEIVGIGLTGQMHGMVLLDKKRPSAAPLHHVERPAHTPPNAPGSWIASAVSAFWS